MKTLCNKIILLLTCMSLSIFAKSCPNIIATVFGPNPQTGIYNYFGVRVTIDQPQDNPITVKGYIFETGSFNKDHPFTLTIPVGDMSIETDVRFLQASPSSDAEIQVSYSTPCIDEYIQAAQEHNNALAYISTKLNLTSGTKTFSDLYNFANEYCSNNGNSLQGISFNELQSIVSNTNGVTSIINNLRTTFPNSFSENEKNELINLYNSVSGLTSDEAVETALSAFSNRTKNSSLDPIEKDRLLAVVPTIYKICEFWSENEESFANNNQKSSNFSKDLAVGFDNEFYKNEFTNNLTEFKSEPTVKKCRIWCVICIAIADAAAYMAMNTINPLGAPFYAAVISGAARCCGCGKCGSDFGCP